MTDSGWTAQAKAHLDQSDVFPTFPGQIVTKDQLPDPKVQEDAGIDSQQWLRNAGHLFVESDVSVLSTDRRAEEPASAPKKAAAKGKVVKED